MRFSFWVVACVALSGCSSESFTADSDAGDAAATADADAASTADALPKAPVVYRGASSGVRTPTALTFSVPGTTVVGDVVLAFIQRDPSIAFAAPAAFTLVASDTSGAKCGTIYRGEIYKATYAGEAMQFTGDPGPTGDIAANGVLLGYGGADLGTVQNAETTSQNLSATLDVKAIPDTFPGSIAIAAAEAGEPLAIGPAGMTDRASFGTKRGWVFDLSLPNGGPIPARSFVSLNTATLCGTVFQIVLPPK
jgi:hypothetical protein